MHTNRFSDCEIRYEMYISKIKFQIRRYAVVIVSYIFLLQQHNLVYLETLRAHNAYRFAHATRTLLFAAKIRVRSYSLACFLSFSLSHLEIMYCQDKTGSRLELYIYFHTSLLWVYQIFSHSICITLIIQILFT